MQDQVKKLISEGENEIKDNITKLTNNIFQKDYSLLDKNWFNKYQNVLYNNSNENIFKMTFYPNFKDKTYIFGNKSYTFSIPTNFVLVKKEVIQQLLNYYDKNEQNKVPNLIYDVVVGGECLIIKNKNYNNAFYVSLNNLNNIFYYNNDINFILIYKDTQELTLELYKILQKGFLSYLDENEIKQDGKSHDIFNSNGELIGHIIHYTELQYTYTNKILTQKKVFKSKNLQKEIKHTYEMNQILHSIMLCLFQTKQLVNEINNNNYKSKKTMVQLFFEYFQNIQKDCSKVNSKLNSQINPNMVGTYKDIISEMFSKLDKELIISKMKDTYKQGQINQFSETSSKKKMNEKIKNSSIVEKLFYIIFEIKAICNCGISNYSYESSIFLYINLDKENKNVLISDQLINNKKPKNIQCHFCGQKINNLNDIKIIKYPKILIVILEGENYSNFSIKSQKEININNRLYQLYCLCENNNTFYFKSNGQWYTNIDNINCMEITGIETTKPVILFYHFYSFIENDWKNINKNINNFPNNKISPNNYNIISNNIMNNKIINNFNNNYLNNNIKFKINNNINMNNNFIHNNMNINMNNNNNKFNLNDMNNNFKNNNMNINNNFFSNNMQMNNINNMNMNIKKGNFFYNNVNMNNNLFNNNMNFNMNNNFYNNNMNFNMNNFNNKKNNIPLLKSQNIFLTFILNGKQLFIESNQNEIFQVIISKLEKKYNWVKNINKKAYLYNNQVINIQNTLKQLNIPDNSTIYITS